MIYLYIIRRSQFGSFLKIHTQNRTSLQIRMAQILFRKKNPTCMSFFYLSFLFFQIQFETPYSDYKRKRYTLKDRQPSSARAYYPIEGRFPCFVFWVIYVDFSQVFVDLTEANTQIKVKPRMGKKQYINSIKYISNQKHSKKYVVIAKTYLFL